MPTFAIIAHDHERSVDLRRRIRPHHLEHLRRNAPIISLAGARLNGAGEPVGSVLIVESPAYADAARLIALDPYAQAGLFSHIEVAELRLVDPADSGPSTEFGA